MAGKRNPDHRVVRRIRRELRLDDLPPLPLPYEDGLLVRAMTEDEIAYAVRNAPRAPRTALGAPEVAETTHRPIDWDLAVGEPLARGRIPAEGEA